MNLFNFKKEKEKPEMALVDLFKFAMPEIPLISESRNKEYVNYGADNLYPEKLSSLLNQSAIHNSIVLGKAAMMAGKGFFINGAKTPEENKLKYDALPVNTKIAYDNFLNNQHDELDIQEIVQFCSLDYQTYGSYAIEIIWNTDFTQIVRLKYVEVKNIRSGKLINNKITEYFYSRDWSQAQNKAYKPVSIPAFDIDDKEHYNQLIYVKNGTLQYYGEPFYKGSLTWINIDAKMANFHLSNIENGFAPSMSIKFYQKPDSPEKQAHIVSQIKKQYSGGSNAGKALIFFSDGKDLAPDVEAINVSNLDKQYLALSELATQNILTGAAVTSPLLFGIAVPGSLGGNTELDISYKIFNNSVITPDRIKIEKVINKILKINKIDVTITIEQFNPLV